ncbi:unnamed protein product [Moneuplotes crassus]|uniref:CLASP N-terminal domain-containing protein n=1 Tax=Euplotes crassus TaxID=5936 RepID=A0AAD1XSM4_EUPCR|nr:unnamed protein product [Moneuplotes crassus]
MSVQNYSEKEESNSNQEKIGSGKGWQIKNIISILKDNKNDWIQRKECFRRIRVYCSQDPTTIQENILNLYEPISTQIQELRSAIVKECCNTILKICKCVPTYTHDSINKEMEILINKLMEPECLPKQLNSGNKTISSLIDECIRRFLSTNTCTKFIPCVSQILQTYKNPAVHCRMSEYLCIYLQTHPKSVIEDNLKLTNIVLELLLNDSDSKTRKNAKKAFELYKLGYNQNAEKIFNRLPSQIISSINKMSSVKSKKNRSRPVPSEFSKSQTIALSIRTSPKRKARRVSCRIIQPKDAISGEESSYYAMKRIQCNNSRPASRGRMKSPLVNKSRGNRYNILNLSKTSGISIKSPSRGKENILQCTQKILFSCGDDISTVSKRGRGLQRASSQARFSLKSHSRSSIRNRSLKPAVRSENLQENFSLLGYLSSLESISKSKVWSDRYEVCSNLIKTIKSQYTPSNPNNSSLQSSSKASSKLFQSPSSLVPKGSKSNSKPIPQSSKPLKQTTNKICTILLPLLSDSHSKIKQKSQNTTYILLLSLEKLQIDRNSLISALNLSKLVMKILNNLTDKKKEVQESALRLIDKLRKVFDKDLLVLTSVDVLPQMPHRGRIATFEFIASMVKKTRVLGRNRKAMSKVIKACLAYLDRNVKDNNFVGPILSIILCMRDLNLSETLRILSNSNLVPSEYESLVKICTKYAPDLLQEMSMFKAQKQTKIPKTTDSPLKAHKTCKPFYSPQNEKKSMKSNKIFSKTQNPENLAMLKNFSKNPTLLQPNSEPFTLKFTPEGYTSITLLNRVTKLKSIAKRHIKSHSQQRVEIDSNLTRNVKPQSNNLLIASKTVSQDFSNNFPRNIICSDSEKEYNAKNKKEIMKQKASTTASIRTIDLSSMKMANQVYTSKLPKIGTHSTFTSISHSSEVNYN